MIPPDEGGRLTGRRRAMVAVVTLRRSALAIAAACLLLPTAVHAGPPYVTDDPETVEFLHWEIYLATQDELTPGGATGTAPQLEVNFGAAPNLQLHLIAPLAYARPARGPAAYGPGDVELGAKLRLVEEGQGMPMVGVFPLVELPAGSEPNGLGTGHVRVFIPLWLQKSFGPWTTYGGGGYWVNPGPGNQNYWYVGWQAQRRLSELATVGGEVYYTTADRIGGDANLRFNVGLVLDITDHHHVLLSAGRSLAGDSRFQGYLSYQLTF
jgi:hypothetical protein